MNEVEAKLEKVRGWLRESRNQAILFASQEWFAWITAGKDSHVSLGTAVGAAWVLVTACRASGTSFSRAFPSSLSNGLGIPRTVARKPWGACVIRAAPSRISASPGFRERRRG